MDTGKKQKSSIRCGCIFSALLIGLVVCGMVVFAPFATFEVLKATYGDTPMIAPYAAAQTGMSLNELIADREAAKAERGWEESCEVGFRTAFYGGSGLWFQYADAALDPGGPLSEKGRKIDPRDWDDGYIPVGAKNYIEAVYHAMAGLYYGLMVNGIDSMTVECNLRLPNVSQKRPGN